MRHLERANLQYPSLWRGCVGAWAPLLGPTGTTLRDQSTHGNHGTLTNMEIETDWQVRGGKHALYYQSNDYVEAAPVITGYPFTMSAWAEVNDLTRTQSMFFMADSSSSSKFFGISFRGATAGDYFAFVGRNTTYYQTTGTTSAVLNQWYHVVGIAKSATLREIYVNGKLEATDTNSISTVPTFDNVTIGVLKRNGLTEFWDGWIDDCMIHNRALSESEIQLLATRRGIAYETHRQRNYKASAPAPAGSQQNLMLLGVS